MKGKCVVYVLCLIILQGCGALKYYSMKPSEAVKEAEFYSKFNVKKLGGEITFIVKIVSDPLLNEDCLFFWVINNSNKPIEFNFLMDKISYFVGEREYFPNDHNTILEYPESLNPGRYLLHGNVKAIRFPQEYTGQITAVAWDIWSLQRKLVIMRKGTLQTSLSNYIQPVNQNSLVI